MTNSPDPFVSLTATNGCIYQARWRSITEWRKWCLDTEGFGWSTLLRVQDGKSIEVCYGGGRSVSSHEEPSSHG